MFHRALNDPTGIAACIEEHGVVVVNVLPLPLVKSLIQEFQNVLHDMGCTKLDIMDPYTYEHANTYMSRYGIIGAGPVFTKVLNEARLHPHVRQAMASATGCTPDELEPCFDRLGWMRPVLGPKSEDWSAFATPPGLHLDVAPALYFEEKGEAGKRLNALAYVEPRDLIKENNLKDVTMGTHMQAVINLFPNFESCGGFQCVPGGHHLLPEWYAENKARLSDVDAGKYVFGKQDYQFCKPVRVPCQPGDMIIFRADLPHGALPNQSNMNRAAIFLRYIPRNVFENKTLKRRRALIKRFM